MHFDTVWFDTWIFERTSYNNSIYIAIITPHAIIIGYPARLAISKGSVQSIETNNRYRQCHSKNCYYILLYYEPIGVFHAANNRLYTDDRIYTVLDRQPFENVMPIVDFGKKLQQRSRRRQRRRHLNSFCDNFKTI